MKEYHEFKDFILWALRVSLEDKKIDISGFTENVEKDLNLFCYQIKKNRRN
jgi:hypothetical protein